MKHFLIFQFLFILLISCGYKPVYQISRPILDYKINIIVKSSEENKIDISYMTKFLEQKLQTSKLNPSSLKLVIGLNKSNFNLGLQKDLTTTKYGVKYSANFIFFDRKGVITNGTVEKQSSYDLGQSPYANIVANETTSKNLLEKIAN